jgi:hypothetical protein
MRFSLGSWKVTAVGQRAMRFGQRFVRVRAKVLLMMSRNLQYVVAGAPPRGLRLTRRPEIYNGLYIYQKEIIGG